MNLIRCRSLLPEFVTAGLLTPQGAALYAHAPIFQYTQYSTLGDPELEWCRQELIGPDGVVPTRLPYATFILAGKDGGLAYVSNRPFSFRGPQNLQRTCLLAIIQRWQLDGGGEAWMRCFYTGQIEAGIVTHCWRNGQPLIVDDAERVRAWGDIANGAGNLVIHFAYDTMCPGSVVLRVKPGTPGKSVAWVAARTHYCILNRKQAEVLRHRRTGPSEQSLQRGAHSRRGFLRRLRAPIYKANRGKLVPVKQTWVGPTEWAGTDRKIYTVIPSGTPGIALPF